jgi:hypothetical protein
VSPDLQLPNEPYHIHFVTIVGDVVGSIKIGYNVGVKVEGIDVGTRVLGDKVGIDVTNVGVLVGENVGQL